MRSTENGVLVEHVFRHEYGKMVSYLVNKFGPSHLESIEDAVQEALIKAMQVWGYKEPPKNPAAWLLRVAHNQLIDRLRRDKKMVQSGDGPLLEKSEFEPKEIHLDDTINDSQLKMIFACCHPSLSTEHQIILSLKLIGGFGNVELAKALLKKEAAVAKSYTRAKKKFKEKVPWLQVPVEMGLQSRLFVVLRVIYLLFTEGYSVTAGSQVLKRDICYEAMRLALLLKKNSYCQHPNLEALIALMCFHAARFDARLDTQGEMVDLEHQDRSKYNRELIGIGIRHLENAGTEDKLPSNYHLEAAVSYYHSTAKTFAGTDWGSILKLYDLQLKTQYSPMAALNRIVPFSKVHGAERALTEFKVLEKTSDYGSIGLFYAIKAELLKEIGDRQWRPTLEKAIDLTENQLAKRHLKKKLI
ncbi:RNA polymerase sigma factor [Allomuricauda sp. SCSIO 65647]|uniref:RNA polymerase sigma factor n=1 Tax=Allomuricauda sp. SCSIO 65647 TaxID=2908843 RepID=UPI001F38199A|nr:sigma-70 family RNA polymerase sigma factor [Muricauda sp. SCSIO 65647]UJH68906.1 sigma-70 family RNA polymerase sigma factor [Muricauda sp. SCSIO 65647]